MFELGEKLKCKVTGVAVARIQYVNGCTQYELQPSGAQESGKMKAASIIL